MSARITAIEPLPSDPNVLRIRVDGRVVARLPRVDVEALDLEADTIWTDALAKRIDQAVATNKTRKAALSLLGRRALSRNELVARLVAKGHDQAMTERLADDLVTDGWLDDVAYAHSIAHRVMRRKPASAELLLHAMTSHKIDLVTAQRVTDEVLGDVDPVDAATAFALERLESAQSLRPGTAARRIAAALARRGFDEETIEAAIHRSGLLDDDSPAAD